MLRKKHVVMCYQIQIWPILVAARSKAWVCGCSLVGIVGSNPVRGMNVCLLRMLRVVRRLCVGLITHPEKSYRLWSV